jgi:hypothetical protein
VILSLVAALAFSNVAYAANKPSAHVYHIKGSVVGVNTYAMTIRVATPQGKLTINLDSHTVYKGIISCLSELTPGMVVNVCAKLLPNHEYLAEICLQRGSVWLQSTRSAVCPEQLARLCAGYPSQCARPRVGWFIRRTMVLAQV